MKKIDMRKVVNGGFTTGAVTEVGLQVALKVAPQALKFIPGVGIIITAAQGVTLATAVVKAVLEYLKVADKKVLLVVKEFDENLILASRNLKNLVLILADEINVLDIVGTDVMVVTEDALKFIEEVLK